MKKTAQVKANLDWESGINAIELNLHPLLKDIEHIFILFMISAKALSLPETQVNLSADINFSQILKKYNETTSLHTVYDSSNHTYKTELNVMKQMNFLGKAISILMYDFILASKYNDILGKDTDFQFLKYVRNGAAHNNHFNMKDEKGEWKIEEREILGWHDKKITRELHGKLVFPDFVTFIHMILLANEISKKLTQIDQQSHA